MFRNIFIILLSIAMSSTAHVFLKKGMMPTVTETPPLQGICDHIWVTATNPWILGGMTLHVSALVVWLWALSRVDITFAYPFLAFGYVLVSLMAWTWLGEHLSQTRILGMVIIIGGIFILSRGG
jgi:multidrug transporter EmrE-like cation transporter